MRIRHTTAVAYTALFLSLTGGAFAAGYTITSVSQISPTVRHALQGHRGPPGPRGTAGPAGAAGSSGRQGDPGIMTGGGYLDWTATYRITSDVVNLSPGSPTATVLATCNAPNGQPDHVINGGYDGSNIVVTSSLPRDAGSHSWLISAHLEPGAYYGTVTATATCMS